MTNNGYFKLSESGDDFDEDEFDNDDDDYEDDLFDTNETRKWNINEKLNNSNKFNAKYVKFLNAKVNQEINESKEAVSYYTVVSIYSHYEFDYKYIEKNGFNEPLVFLEKSGLGLRVPSENFKVSDVKSCVGSKRLIDVMDVNTQKALTMTMKDWCEYYEQRAARGDRLLNVISLEFSHTKLENYVEAPLVVRQLDWIETAWPQCLRATHTESTNLIEKMKYPKVQKYVLMSVAECYTDFHIDMGGTSVWYHILKGEKIFWLIPPSEKNLKIYAKWILSGEQENIFLADLVDECEMIVLKQGSTFMLPSGWIHAVYTSQDSLVFGGNFLHSYNIPMQLKVYQIETKTKVPAQYRYPFFIQMIWFLIERYVHCLTGVTHLENKEFCFNASNDEMTKKSYQTFEAKNARLNKCEYEGLIVLYEFLSGFSEQKRNVPKEIVEPDILMQRLKKIITENSFGDDSKPPTGAPFIYWPKPEKRFLKKVISQQQEQDLKQAPAEIYGSAVTKSERDKFELKIDEDFLYETNSLSNGNISSEETSTNGGRVMWSSRKHVMRNLPRTKGSIKKRLRPQNVPRSNVERRRRVRCHKCEPCTRDDCGECKYCKDMKKFGGTGISKQCCLSKQCLQPLLPTTTTCMLCHVLINRKYEDVNNLIYECEICFEIYHSECFKSQYDNLKDVEPVVNEDLNNCWTCPNCVHKGYNKLDGLTKQVSSRYSNNSDSSSVLSLLCNSSSSCHESLNLSEIKHEQLTSSQESNAQIKPIKKRQRRTKQEIQDSKQFLQRSEICNSTPLKKRRSNHIEKTNLSTISVDSLTNLEKEIILSEFCEISSNSDQNDPFESLNDFDHNDYSHLTPIKKNKSNFISPGLAQSSISSSTSSSNSSWSNNDFSLVFHF